jgi:hypothetical protein
MLDGVPNVAMAVGYTNAFWTLKTELIAQYVCRLLKHMVQHGYDTCMPIIPEGGIEEGPLLDLEAGYVLRAKNRLPKQGNARPWKLFQNYILDRVILARGSVKDDSILFRKRGSVDVARPQEPAASTTSITRLPLSPVPALASVANWPCSWPSRVVIYPFPMSAKPVCRRLRHYCRRPR